MHGNRNNFIEPYLALRACSIQVAKQRVSVRAKQATEISDKLLSSLKRALTAANFTTGNKTSRADDRILPQISFPITNVLK